MSRKGPISGKTLYTAEEYLNMPEYHITGRLKKEINEIERKYDEGKVKKQKTIKTSYFINKLVEDKDIKCNKSKGYIYVKYKGKLLCWIADRKYGVSVSLRKGGKSITHRVTTIDEMMDIVNMLKENMNDIEWWI